MYTWTHINVTKFSKERGHGFELEKQGIWECFDWGKGNKNDVNLIIISKVKNVISLSMTLLKKSYQGSKKLEKKSVWNRITGGKKKSISESYRMQNNGLLNNEKKGS